MSKRINTFFQPLPSKKPKPDPSIPSSPATYTHHPSYPIPIRDLPSTISTRLSNPPLHSPKAITNHPHLDLLYFQSFLPAPLARELFHFLRTELPFYRVQYTIHRNGIPTSINTPRFTTVFGVDDTSTFIPNPTPNPSSSPILVDSKTHTPTKKYYHTQPRPIPPCLDLLRQAIQTTTSDETKYNFILVNYYASDEDSISYHSDDEQFLGPSPTIASLSLGGTRDFLLKPKPKPKQLQDGSSAVGNSTAKPLKFPLHSGHLLIMRGETQRNWLHSVPKRKGGGGAGGMGRINITFRRAVVPGGTENYYRYNVGDGVVYRWREDEGRMVASAAAAGEVVG
ncbi:hypothetical protein BO78DRAFT_168496 [Aspergillus sclerotiicarbonarius CBS 121057]|uniref:Fe2OG dioxygenase domain-containing protein n=1 Tax=Aspergillus sclerotiicarbonarius (strain CBS 121057 / IBT 28362) TaxID=1448318 RepID=A0A319E3F1_ASPSB|nr:hypothetical protein BO78DRAFT_168496 [Aspergillus sclerotiicarbonarius CBS 121057]